MRQTKTQHIFLHLGNSYHHKLRLRTELPCIHWICFPHTNLCLNSGHKVLSESAASLSTPMTPHLMSISLAFWKLAVIDDGHCIHNPQCRVYKQVPKGTAIFWTTSVSHYFTVNIPVFQCSGILSQIEILSRMTPEAQSPNIFHKSLSMK